MERNSVFQVIISFLLFLLIALTLVAILLMGPLKKSIQSGDYTKSRVQDSVLRFHVRANSDSEEDQTVKMQVKEAVLEKASEYLEADFDKNAVKEALATHLEELTRTAEQTLAENGYDYGVRTYFTREEFPVKRYGDLTFPAGTYDALRMDLGEGEGHNWWCMIYPSLCFVDVTYGVVPEESKEELQGLLTREDYQELLADPDTEVEVHSALWDLVKKWSTSH